MTLGQPGSPPPLIYNLFPRLAGNIEEWGEHCDRAARLGFNWLYLNPPFYPGFSGSIYSVKDFKKLDPVICPEGQENLDLQALEPLLEQARESGLRPMVDLVINHTAKDSELVKSHPDWYFHDEDGEVRSPFAIDPADARNKTVWGDLAELDHESSTDPEGLKALVIDIVSACLDVGFEGFRCDAAYKVPVETWQYVIESARKRVPDSLFLAETLGCHPHEMMALEDAGFDYVMNSSKYWAFDAPWCLDQHEDWQKVAPSVAFPESHDTPRLAAETGGLERVVRQRFCFASVFSAGILMPIGFEFGFQKQINVVETRSSDWEQPTFDLTTFIKELLRIKVEYPILSSEGHFKALTSFDQPTLVLEKSADSGRVLILINKDWHYPQGFDMGWITREFFGGGEAQVLRPCINSFSPETIDGSTGLTLEPAEIAILPFT